jgi:sarcosine oxidase subunit beta
MTHPDVVIIGAGISGVSSALSLAEAGAKVEVIERYYPAAMASGWTLAGIRQSGRDERELDLARAAIGKWETLDEQLGIKTGYVQSGNLRLARNSNEAHTISTLVKNQKLRGLTIELLDQKSIAEVCPSLSRNINAASFCPSDGHANPIATVKGFRSAAERLGVQFRTGTSVRKINISLNKNNNKCTKKFHSLITSNGRVFAGSCILAAGVEVNTLLKTIGLQIPIKTPLVAVIETESLPPIISPVIGVANADLAIKQQSNGKILFTSGGEFTKIGLSEENGSPIVSPPMKIIGNTIKRAIDVLPILSRTPIRRTWGGLLDLTPDSLPILDQVSNIEGLIIASGFSGHGFGIGPAVGDILADLTLQKAPKWPIEAFRYDRFQNIKQDQKSFPQLHG